MKFELTNTALTLITEEERIEIEAPGETDYFRDICSDYEKANAPFYNTSLTGDFILRCKVHPDFSHTYDAGCLLVYGEKRKWIKFAFEKTDLGYTSVVSVVTNGFSDDANGERIDGPALWLQVVRRDNNWALHYSLDKVHWKMVRYFQLETGRTVKAGISAQSPAGKGCMVLFSGLEVLENTYENIRMAKEAAL